MDRRTKRQYAVKQIIEPDPSSVEEKVLSLASSSPFITRLCEEVENPVWYFSKLYKHFSSLYLPVKLPLPPVRPCGKNGRPITFKAYRHLDELAGKQGTINLRKIVNYTCAIRLEWGVCGRAFNTSNSGSEGAGFKPRQSRCFPRQET